MMGITFGCTRWTTWSTCDSICDTGPFDAMSVTPELLGMVIGYPIVVCNLTAQVIRLVCLPGQLHASKVVGSQLLPLGLTAYWHKLGRIMFKIEMVIQSLTLMDCELIREITSMSWIALRVAGCSFVFVLFNFSAFFFFGLGGGVVCMPLPIKSYMLFINLAVSVVHRNHALP